MQGCWNSWPKFTAKIIPKSILIHYLKSTKASTPSNVKQTQQQQSHQQSPVFILIPVCPRNTLMSFSSKRRCRELAVSKRLSVLDRQQRSRPVTFCRTGCLGAFQEQKTTKMFAIALIGLMLSDPHWSMSPKEHNPDMSGRYTTEVETNMMWSGMLLNANGRNQNRNTSKSLPFSFNSILKSKMVPV